MKYREATCNYFCKLHSKKVNHIKYINSHLIYHWIYYCYMKIRQLSVDNSECLSVSEIMNPCLVYLGNSWTFYKS